MFYCYILYSEKLNRYYYGHTIDLESRLNEHNRGKERFTSGGIPWKIHYFEMFETKSEAAKREKFFKSIDGYNSLRKTGIIPK